LFDFVVISRAFTKIRQIVIAAKPQFGDIRSGGMTHILTQKC
jgi:hypothetical protein